MDTESIYKALIKCNNIGKKMGNGIYVIVDGLLVSESDLDDDDTKSTPFSIAFLDDKLVKQMDALSFIGLEIDGLKLYEYNNKYTFNRFEVDDKYVNVLFNTTYEDIDGFKDNFNNLLKEKGYSNEQIKYHELMNYEADINVYEYYIKYKKQNNPEVINTTISLKMKIVKKDNRYIKKANEIIDLLSYRQVIGEKELMSEIYTKIISSTSPIELSVNNINLRMMKSLFVTGSTKSDVYIRLYDSDNDNISYMVLYIKTSSTTVCNIYKVINY